MSDLQTSVKLPILSISQPLHTSMSSFAEACKEWGFFLIINHGISKDLYNKIYLLSKHIFSLPSDTKLKLGPLSSIKTYTPQFIASPFFESLRVSGPDFFASAQSSADILFDQQNYELGEILQEYGSKMTEVSKKIIEVLLMSLGDGFDTKYYESDFKNCHGYLRIINYSPPESVEKEVEGLGMHTDMSCVTIVYQDEIGGLQVKSKEGKWMDISPCEGTLVVNIGDMLQAWSNDKLRSSEHRVVLKQPVSRFSLAFFWCFEDEKVILAPDEVVGEGNIRTYNPFVCLDYLKFREISSEKGEFEKVGYTVKDFSGIKKSECKLCATV
ncbi:2OG-FeII_Oxy domain-containing protein/DIOX_N domain-containing protein [Cephalotus follicularis]|uniref:2OG-FeII_Oxy domain-containing protein/DIOX_N domain-containing protein n=1 Tax=Cephalotus follicularis TaxID=3775 RepID=A0A1Q3CLM5_CEPFO|nr:2OG-FeII_Oxy domain-containing protein/DIOX_N domain-containing protein [Cephalotus follicularis]